MTRWNVDIAPWETLPKVVDRGFRINSTQVIVAALKEISHIYSSVNYSYTLRRMIMFDFGYRYAVETRLQRGCVCDDPEARC
ncbi:hypothetical protein Pcac1_g20387 [Phytophthora cactorum]|nr:hypothetical protein Pcac1_g20387 [Phytophthora cactorum]